MTSHQKIILGLGAGGALLLVMSKGGLSKLGLGTTAAKPLLPVKPSTPVLGGGGGYSGVVGGGTGRLVGPTATSGGSTSVPLAASVAGGNALGSFLANLFGSKPGTGGASMNASTGKSGSSASTGSGGSAQQGAGKAPAATRSAGNPPDTPTPNGFYDDQGNWVATDEAGNILPDPVTGVAPGFYDTSGNYVRGAASFGNSGINYGGPSAALSGPDDSGQYYDAQGNAYTKDSNTELFYDSSGNAYDASLNPVVDQPAQPVAVDENGNIDPSQAAAVTVDNGWDGNQYSNATDVPNSDNGVG